jgi:hypothetical protein
MSLDDRLQPLPSRFVDSLFPSPSTLRDDKRFTMTQPLPTIDYREKDRLLELGKVKPVELRDDRLKPIYPEIKPIPLPKPMESTTDYRSKLREQKWI